MLEGETVTREMRGEDAREIWTLSEPPFPAPSPPFSLCWVDDSLLEQEGTQGEMLWGVYTDHSNTTVACGVKQSSKQEQVVDWVKKMLTTQTAVKTKLKVVHAYADIICIAEHKI